jgi:hypothetical protein
VRGEDDELEGRADGAHLFEEGEGLGDGGVGAGDDDAEGTDANSLESVGVAGGVFDRQIAGGEGVTDVVAYVIAAFDDENPAHARSEAKGKFDFRSLALKDFEAAGCRPDLRGAG